MNMKFLVSCLVLFVLVAATAAKNPRCDGFDYVYHFGDGVTDIGNAVLIVPNKTTAANHYPYGISTPSGKPSGRWCDGYIDFDFAADDFGVPDLQPYLKKNFTNAVIFSVARSPVLDRGFFAEQYVEIEQFAVSLEGQYEWFKNYMEVVCPVRDGRDFCKAQRLDKTLVIFGDIEGNDLGYLLSQGKSIEEVKTFIPSIVNKQVEVIKDIIKMGATKVMVPANSPIGCFPYILTARETTDESAYDERGCLIDVNDLVDYKNDLLNRSINTLISQYPDYYIVYAPFNEGVDRYFQNVSKIPEIKANLLKSCCGIGGKYNFDPNHLCGSKGVPHCADPKKYVFWDGFHMTAEAQYRIQQDLVQDFLVQFNCTKPASAATATMRTTARPMGLFSSS